MGGVTMKRKQRILKIAAVIQWVLLGAAIVIFAVDGMLHGTEVYDNEPPRYYVLIALLIAANVLTILRLLNKKK